jgi:subtilisin family serine protease
MHYHQMLVASAHERVGGVSDMEQEYHPPWQIMRTGFPTAWRLWRSFGVRRRPIHVAMLDSGVDLHHPMLSRVLGSGANLLYPDEPPLDENGHGTHVAGSIAAAVGVFANPSDLPPIILHPVKLFDPTGYGRIHDIVRGLYWCIDAQIDLVNLSFGTDLKTSKALHRAVRAVDEAGILLVGAAGNDGRRAGVDYPGRYPEVLAVGSSTRSDRLSSFSSVGPEVDLIAPGSGVVSLAPGGKYRRMSGTSMAVPLVTAAAALLKGAEPHLAPSGMRARLKAAAEWLPQVPTSAQGAGLLRADRLLR